MEAASPAWVAAEAAAWVLRVDPCGKLSERPLSSAARAMSEVAVAQTPQASLCSGSLFRQPLISFLTLVFPLAGIERNALQNQ